MTTQFTPAVNLTNSYMNNVSVAWASTTTLTVGAGQVRDSNNVIDMKLSSSVTINAATTGANGLDTGSLANSTWYYIYLIGDSSGFNSTAALVSTSASAPTLPSGYDSLRMIGATLTDGSAHFLKFWQAAVGSSSLRTFYFDTSQICLNAGTATSFTSISVACVPPITGTQGIFIANYTPATANNTFSVNITGSTGNGYSYSGQVAAKVTNAEFMLPVGITSSNASINYLVSNGSDALSVYVKGFVMAL